MLTSVARTNFRPCRRVCFVVWVGQFGNYGVWPVLLEGRKGDVNEYSRSALEKVKIAIQRGGWYAFRTVPGQRAYQLRQATEDYGEPKWPSGGADQILDKCLAQQNLWVVDSGSGSRPKL